MDVATSAEENGKAGAENPGSGYRLPQLKAWLCQSLLVRSSKQPKPSAPQFTYLYKGDKNGP